MRTLSHRGISCTYTQEFLEDLTKLVQIDFDRMCKIMIDEILDCTGELYYDTIMDQTYPSNRLLYIKHDTNPDLRMRYTARARIKNGELIVTITKRRFG